MKLDHHDIAILRLLDEQAGASTGLVASHAQLAGFPRSNSQVVLRRLKVLELAGFVCRLDDQKPIAWTRTAAGTARLTEAAA